MACPTTSQPPARPAPTADQRNIPAQLAAAKTTSRLENRAEYRGPAGDR